MIFLEAAARTFTLADYSVRLHRSQPTIGAVCRARSTADMIAKLGIVEEEADGTRLSLLLDARKTELKRCLPLINEANEIVAMTVASIKTLRVRLKANPKSKI